MKNYLFYVLVLYMHTMHALSQDTLYVLGDKIWKNECAGTFDGLTYWNQGENFASLGIGHFIWYPPDAPKLFQETFPDLLQFLKKNKVDLPSWLKYLSACPWRSQEDFYANFDHPDMQDLRHLLFETRHLQTLFIVQRLENSLSAILPHLSQHNQHHVTSLFLCLKEDAQGLYALIDYLNFKGLGIYPSEAYHGQGWGLLQVLQNMPHQPHHPLIAFVETAKQILIQRVRNAPADKQEEKWLQGWLNRLDTYLNPL